MAIIIRLPYAIAIPSGVDGILAVVAFWYSVRFSFVCVEISFTVLAMLDTSTPDQITSNYKKTTLDLTAFDDDEEGIWLAFHEWKFTAERNSAIVHLANEYEYVRTCVCKQFILFSDRTEY